MLELIRNVASCVKKVLSHDKCGHGFIDIISNNRSTNFHNNGSVLWSIEKELIEFIEKNLKPESNTLETGVGMSTALFLYKRCNHTVIAPVKDEYDQVVRFCNDNGIDAGQVKYLENESQDILPLLKLDPLDFVLIDGGHGFPIPFVDWLYTAKHLKVGGKVVIDDIQIWTGKILMDFLAAENQWKQIVKFNKSVVFEKIAENVVQDWGGQPFVVASSAIPQDWPWLANILKGLAVQGELALDMAISTNRSDITRGNNIELLIKKHENIINKLNSLNNIIS